MAGFVLFRTELFSKASILDKIDQLCLDIVKVMESGKKHRNELLSIVIDQIRGLSVSEKKKIHELLSNELKTIKRSSLLDSDEMRMFQEIFSKC